ncbi:MAG: endonuclease/exonuclease/phosphatase family protein [Propionibacteriaceae bacterium]|nr:endonuclease/exonuclease/phosphatase family protein [Propionibacteriaceae bacterium]
MNYRSIFAARIGVLGTVLAVVAGASLAAAPTVSAASLPASGSPAALTAALPLAETRSTAITVSAYNVHKSSSGPSWSGRRAAVAKNLTDQEPDVIALAEATPASVISPSGAKVKQYNDLLALIDDDIPYEFAAAGDYTNGTKLAYNSRRLTVLNEGSKILKKLGTQRRYAVWAVFADKTSGERVFVVATHLEPGKGSSTVTKYNSTRITQAKQIVNLINDKNPMGHPVVIAGDFNSSRGTKPSNGPYNVFLKYGFVDPLDNAKASWSTGANAIAESMPGVEYNSANHFERTAARTKFPIGTHVDYILVSKGTRVAQYRMVVDVEDGKFVGTIPSDHNQVKAVVRLP